MPTYPASMRVTLTRFEIAHTANSTAPIPRNRKSSERRKRSGVQSLKPEEGLSRSLLNIVIVSSKSRAQPPARRQAKQESRPGRRERQRRGADSADEKPREARR